MEPVERVVVEQISIAYDERVGDEGDDGSAGEGEGDDNGSV